MADEFARQLRKAMTDAERRLWSQLRGRQIDEARFRRQAPIGRFIADFACFERGLIIELDGSQHAVRTREYEERTAWLESQGFRVMRFWNNLIFEELDAVLDAIGMALTAPHPSPPPQGGRGSDCGLEDFSPSPLVGEGRVGGPSYQPRRLTTPRVEP